MDKTIVAMGLVLIALGIGMWIAKMINVDLHSAYVTGGVMWMALGVITIGVGLKKRERLRQSAKSESITAYKSAIGQ